MRHSKNGYRTFRSKIRDLRLASKFTIVLLLLLVVRIGSTYPLPFVNAEYMKALLNIQGLSFFNSITGGSMQQMSFFALSIGPYITSSIVMQLLTVVIPSIEELQKDGKTGRDKYMKLTKGVAVGLAVVQSTAMAVGLGAQGLLISYTPAYIILASVIWSIGSVVLIGISTFIDWMEIGSGISILLCANILCTFPADVMTLISVFIVGREPMTQVINGFLIIATILLIIGACVWMNGTRKEIPVINSRKMNGHVSSSNFPIPLNTCLVMPVIFAGSIISFPILITQFIGAAQSGIPMHIINCLTTTKWFNPEQPYYTIGAVLYFALTTFFTYFYLEIGFNPLEIADNLKKSGATIPGIRPGMPTAEYIRKHSTRIALTGNTLLTSLILAMYLICNVSNIGTLSIAGTSIIICVSVTIEESKLISSLLQVGTFSKRAKKENSPLRKTMHRPSARQSLTR